MDKIDPNTIRLIAQSIECGELAFYNHKTGEVISIPDIENGPDHEYFSEAFAVPLKKVKNPDFIKLSPLESKVSFEIMESFVESLNDSTFKYQLIELLDKPKPFRNFKNKIDYSEFRQQWFDFKQKEIEKIVEKVLEEKLS